MKMIIDSVLFNEADLKEHNPDGFRAVQEAVEAVVQAKVTARTPEEKQRAIYLAEKASDRRISELKLGETAFNKMRNQAFFTLGNARAKLGRSSVSGAQRQELEQRIDSAITDWTMKRFTVAKIAAKEVESALPESNPPAVARPVLVIKPVLKAALSTDPQSPSAWFELGLRREKNQQFAKAADAFQRVMDIAPRHPLAPAALTRVKRKAVAAQNPVSTGGAHRKGA